MSDILNDTEVIGYFNYLKTMNEKNRPMEAELKTELELSLFNLYKSEQAKNCLFVDSCDLKEEYVEFMERIDLKLSQFLEHYETVMEDRSK
jgi:hypothetical protein